MEKHLNAINSRRIKANDSPEKLKRSDSVIKKNDDEKTNEFDDYINKLQNNKKEENEQKLKKKKVANIINRNRDLNMDSKKLMKDLHKKTHFMAVKHISNHHNENGNFC